MLKKSYAWAAIEAVFKNVYLLGSHASQLLENLKNFGKIIIYNQNIYCLYFCKYYKTIHMNTLNQVSEWPGLILANCY